MSTLTIFSFVPPGLLYTKHAQQSIKKGRTNRNSRIVKRTGTIIIYITVTKRFANDRGDALSWCKNAYNDIYCDLVISCQRAGRQVNCTKPMSMYIHDNYTEIFTCYPNLHWHLVEKSWPENSRQMPSLTSSVHYRSSTATTCCLQMTRSLHEYCRQKILTGEGSSVRNRT